MDEETTLRPSKLTALITLLGLIAVSSVGLFIMALHSSKSAGAWISYIYAGFFACLVIMTVLRLLPGWCFLKVGIQGIQLRYQFRIKTLSWPSIEAFGVYEYTTYTRYFIPIKHRGVGVRLSPTYEHEMKRSWMTRIGRAITGYDLLLPGNFGMRRDELAKFLNEMKRYYTGNG
jgi:hypothetical protein